MILFPSSHRALHHSPVLLTLTDSHSEPEQHIRVPSCQFYNPWAPCPSCDGPVYCLVTRDTPGHTLGASTPEVRVATTSQSAHVKLVLKTRHQGSPSECCYGRHTLEGNSNGFIIYTVQLYYTLTCGPGSGFLFIFLLSWVMLCPHGKAELCAEGLFNPHTTSWASPNTLQFYTFRGQAPHDLSPNL